MSLLERLTSLYRLYSSVLSSLSQEGYIVWTDNLFFCRQRRKTWGRERLSKVACREKICCDGDRWVRVRGRGGWTSRRRTKIEKRRKEQRRKETEKVQSYEWGEKRETEFSKSVDFLHGWGSGSLKRRRCVVGRFSLDGLFLSVDRQTERDHVVDNRTLSSTTASHCFLCLRAS